MSTPSRRTALVTGVAGQDGIYLARDLLEDGTRVVGTVLPGDDAARRMAPYLAGVTVLEHDVRDTAGFSRLIRDLSPDEVYNLAAFSSVGASWDHPDEARETNGWAVERMLRVLREHPGVRFLQAASAEEEGPARDSPYAQGKAIARAATGRHREELGLFACSAVLFNHESPLRGERFVTRKITRAAAAIALGRSSTVTLGNLQVVRDWGHARDYVRGMRMLLRAAAPADVPFATGVAHSLEELLVRAFAAAGLADPRPYVEQDPALLRPLDAAELIGETEPARRQLGWKASTTFEAMVDEMVAVDLQRLRSGVAESAAYLGGRAGEHPG